MSKQYKVTYYPEWIKIENSKDTQEKELAALLEENKNAYKAIVVVAGNEIPEIAKCLEDNRMLNVLVCNPPEVTEDASWLDAFDLQLECMEQGELETYINSLIQERNHLQIQLIKQCIRNAKPNGGLEQIEEEFRLFCTLVLQKEESKEGL